MPEATVYAGDYASCVVDAERRVATIRLARPPVNALDERAWRELGEVAELAGAEDVGAVIVWGGPKAFAAGADIAHLRTLTPARARRLMVLAQGSVSRLEALPQPTIAAIEGYALGGGLEIALALDFRIVGATAVVGLPEVSLGLLPGAGGTQRLGRLVGLRHARDMVLSGRHVQADEARAIGLVDRVVGVGEAYAVALEQGAEFGRGPYSLRLAKQALNAATSLPIGAGLELEASLVAEAFASRDAQVGLQAFLDRTRPAPFTGA